MLIMSTFIHYIIHNLSRRWHESIFDRYVSYNYIILSLPPVVTYVKRCTLDLLYRVVWDHKCVYWLRDTISASQSPWWRVRCRSGWTRRRSCWWSCSQHRTSVCPRNPHHISLTCRGPPTRRNNWVNIAKLAKLIYMLFYLCFVNFSLEICQYIEAGVRLLLKKVRNGYNTFCRYFFFHICGDF